MLSFMREQGTGNLPDGPSSGPRDSKSSGNADAQEYLTVAANSKNLHKSTILVVILVSIGLVCLWFMIRKSQPQAASANPNEGEASTIEVAISRLTGVSSEMVSRMDEIVKKFYEFSDVFQVQVGELAKNPFEVETFMGAIKDSGAVEGDDQARAALIQRQRLTEKAKTLKLLSVMESEDGNACMISDRIVKKGDVVEGFTITQIGGDFVELDWQGDDGVSNVGAGTEDIKILLKLTQ